MCQRLTRKDRPEQAGIADPMMLASPEQVRSRTAEVWGVSVEALMSKRRNRTVTVPRQVAMYLIKTHLDLPFSDIGVLFGGRDHSTVIHSVGKVEHQMRRDRQFRERIELARRELSAP